MSDASEQATETTEAVKDPSNESKSQEQNEQATLEEGEQENQTAAEEVEIVREGSQPSKTGQSGFRKRVNKLNAKIDTALNEATQANTENALLKEKLKILEMEREQARDNPVSIQPNPDDFDSGVSDPEFIGSRMIIINM